MGLKPVERAMRAIETAHPAVPAKRKGVPANETAFLRSGGQSGYATGGKHRAQTVAVSKSHSVFLGA